MKLYVTSDIHLEFGSLDLHNRHDVDVLILGGDICVARDIGRPDSGGVMEGTRSIMIREFFRLVSERFPHTVWVMGNHEHYHGDFTKTQEILQAMLDQDALHNVHLLEKSTVEIDDYLFIGGTLWTDFNRGDPLALYHARSAMSDFRVIKNSGVHYWKFTPEHSMEEHHRTMTYIQHVIAERRLQGDTSDRVIVVGHHAPSGRSVHEKYRDDALTNACYRSSLDEFIWDRPEICLWTHGHTHEDFDYHISNTRIVCNPRGYHGYEARADAWQPRLIEL
jgi:Icc-related predicted phosphoesterase